MTALGCWLNCSNFSNVYNSNGSNVDNTSCFCNAGATWNSTAGYCQVNCTGQANSNGTNLNATYCNCNSGYKWSPTASGCWIDCQALPNTTGNFNSSQCICGANFYWNATALNCYINCTKVPNSNGVRLTTNTCGCNSNFKFDYWLGLGLAVCSRDCSLYTRTVADKPLSYNNCLCANGYQWNSNNNVCDINCDSMTYSTGSSDGTAACFCLPLYRWEPIAGQCVSKTSTTSAVAIAVGIAVPLGILAIIGLIALIWACLAGGAASAAPVAAVPMAPWPPNVPPMPVPQQFNTTLNSTSRIMPKPSQIKPMTSPRIGYPQTIGYY